MHTKMFIQNKTTYVRTIDTDGTVIYRAYWYENGCYVCTDWRNSISELRDAIADCYEEYGKTQGDMIANTMWLDFNDAPAVSKGRRVDQALFRFMELEQENDTSTKKYETLADFEIANECY